jgi:D-sedoheptulose 7-phosphate isomerase
MLGATLGVNDYLARVAEAIAGLDAGQIEKLSALIEDRWRSGRFVFVAGNGGSGANASHLCEDLAKCTLRDFKSQKRLKVLSLTDNTPWITAVANDLSYQDVFAEQLRNLGSEGDLLIAISGSGNSPNVLRAVEWANENGVETVGVTGFGGGRLRSLARHNVHVGFDDMGVVESVHLTFFHWVIDDLYRRFGAAR